MQKIVFERQRKREKVYYKKGKGGICQRGIYEKGLGLLLNRVRGTYQKVNGHLLESLRGRVSKQKNKRALSDITRGTYENGTVALIMK